MLHLSCGVRSKKNCWPSQRVPASISNCALQLNKYSQKTEILIKRYTNIQPGSKEFNIENVNSIGSTTIKLSDLNDGDIVNVNIKVLEINDPVKVGKNLTKQEILIADGSGNAVLTLWENDINTLELLQCYQVT